MTLPTDDQILVSREFDAPRHLVWKAWTTPELVRQWWSGQRGETTTLEILIRYANSQDRDAHSAYMQDGLQEALDLLGRTAKALAIR